MKIEDLIPDKYYICKFKDDEVTYYFKYKDFIDNIIIDCGFFIKELNGIFYYNDSNGNRLCTKTQFEESIMFKEIDISLIVKHLPIKHPDRVSYHRRDKIKMLLWN